MIFLIILIILILYSLYKRYFPIFGVHFIPLNELYMKQIEILDVRDFSEAHKVPIKNATNIPVAYLRRNLSEIPNGDVYLAGSSFIEINVGVRFLKKKGFRVIGYTVIDNDKLLLKKKLLKLN